MDFLLSPYGLVLLVILLVVLMVVLKVLLAKMLVSHTHTESAAPLAKENVLESSPSQTTQKEDTP